jgi:hypothetical protein
LFLLNQKLQETIQILKQLEKCPWLRRDFLRSFQIEVEDLRAQTNFEVIEHMSDREQHDWAHFGPAAFTCSALEFVNCDSGLVVQALTPALLLSP